MLVLVLVGNLEERVFVAADENLEQIGRAWLLLGFQTELAVLGEEEPQ